MVIYILLDPRTGDPRYVGKAADAWVRLHAHVGGAKRLVRFDRPAKTWYDAWAKKLARLELQPMMQVVAECSTDEELNAAEREWISRMKAEGWPIVNIHPGGCGAPASYRNMPRPSHKPKTIEKMRIPKPDGFGEKIAKVRTEGWAEWRARQPRADCSCGMTLVGTELRRHADRGHVIERQWSIIRECDDHEWKSLKSTYRRCVQCGTKYGTVNRGGTPSQLRQQRRRDERDVGLPGQGVLQRGS